MLETISTQTSILRSPTYFWPKDGNFYAFEGCNGASTPHSPPQGGCCPLNCTHVLNYEQTLSRLFPDLERTQRDLEFGLQMTGAGGIPHRGRPAAGDAPLGLRIRRLRRPLRL